MFPGHWVLWQKHLAIEDVNKQTKEDIWDLLSNSKENESLTAAMNSTP